MPVDLSALEARLARQANQRSMERMAQANIIKAMGERAATLSLSDEWRVWEEHVRALLQEDERQAGALEAELLNPFGAVKHVQQKRTTLMYLKGRMDARRQDLELPAELARRGAESKPGPEAA